MDKEGAYMSVKSRKFELSLMNVFACFLVIFIHCSSAPVTSLQGNTWQYALVFFPWRLSGVAVPAFVFLNGVKLFLSNKKESCGKFYLSKLVRIVVPYVVWVVIYYLYFVKHNYFPFNFKDLALYVVKGDLVAHFYFVILIAQFYLITPLVKKHISKLVPAVVLPIALMVSIISAQRLPNIIDIVIPGYYYPFADRTFTSYIFYWLAGCFVGVNYEKIKEYLSNSFKGVTVWFVFAAFLEATLSYLNASGVKYIFWLEEIRTLYCISGVIFLFSLCIKLGERFADKKLSFIRLADKSSYAVYLSHIFVMLNVNDVIARMNITSIGAAYAVRLAATFIVTLGGCILYTVLKDRIMAKAEFLKRKSSL